MYIICSNMISEMHTVTNSPDFASLLTAWGHFVIMTLCYGIYSVLWMKPSVLKHLRKTMQSGVTSDNVSLLMIYLRTAFLITALDLRVSISFNRSDGVLRDIILPACAHLKSQFWYILWLKEPVFMEHFNISMYAYLSALTWPICPT